MERVEVGVSVKGCKSSVGVVGVRLGVSFVIGMQAVTNSDSSHSA